MTKPLDNSNHLCHNPWIEFEIWGGPSWFPSKLEQEKNEHGDTDTAKRYARIEPSND